MNTSLTVPEKIAERRAPHVSNDQSDITDKKGIAREWSFSVRTVDNLLAQGMPHMKIGTRRCRLSRSEVRAWMTEKFRTVRKG